MASNIDFKFILNGVEIEQIPDGWDEAEVTIEEDRDVKGLLFSYSSRLTFYGDGYEIIKDSFLNNFCEPITCDLYTSCDGGSTFELFSEFLIFVSDDSVTQFDFTRCQVSTQLEDKSFSSLIANNKDIKANFKSNLSKNGVEIDPVEDQILVVGDVNTGLYPVPDPAKKCWLVFDLFRWFVEFMSDQRLSFVSDYFTTNKVVITKGSYIRTTTGETPVISYLELFENLNKLLNLSFRIENGNTIRIEPTNDLFDEDYSIVIDGVDEVTTGISTDNLYSQILVGDTEYEIGEGDFPNLSFKGFDNESFYFLGECNTDEELDTQPEWIYNSNAIQHAQSGNDERDDEIFIIDGFDGGPNTIGTKQQTLFGLAKWFYNTNFTNDKVIERGAGGLPGSLAFLNGNIDGFKVRGIGFSNPGDDKNWFLNSSITPPPEDLYNNNSNFDLTNGFYNVPSVGSYSFGFNILASLDPTNTFIEAIVTYRIKRFDQFDVFIENISESTFTYDVTSDRVFIDETIESDVVQLQQNDRIKFFVELQLGLGPGTTTITTQSNPIDERPTAFTLSTEAGGGIYKTFDTLTTRILTNQFTFWLSDEDYKTITQNISKRIGFTNPQYENGGWIQRLSWKPVKKDASFNLINYGF